MLLKKNKGITLVALVITIVILLILAGISISALTNTGIFQKAKDAKSASENAEKEQNKILDEYETQLDQYNENTLVYKVNNGTIKIGDYVSYIPDSLNDDEVKTLKNNLRDYSGKSNSTINSEIYREDLSWRVLDVQNGQVRLISAAPTDKKIELYGYNGYNNAVYLLDNICKTLYDNSKLASEVQNLKIEDIQDHLTYDYKQNETLIVNTGKYGGTKEYIENKYYPNILKNQNGFWIDGIQGEKDCLSQQIQLLNESYSQAKTNIKMTQTHWYKKMEESDFYDSKYYELFINNGKNYDTYWFSSRCVSANPNNVDFDIRMIWEGSVYSVALYRSDNVNFGASKAVRPVITLNSNVQIDPINKGDGTSPEQAYVIK